MHWLILTLWIQGLPIADGRIVCQTSVIIIVFRLFFQYLKNQGDFKTEWITASALSIAISINLCYTFVYVYATCHSYGLFVWSSEVDRFYRKKSSQIQRDFLIIWFEDAENKVMLCSFYINSGDSKLSTLCRVSHSLENPLALFTEWRLINSRFNIKQNRW